MSFKSFYNSIKKEHLFVFLVILISLILFNYFSFDYTGLTVKTLDSCVERGYSCCSPETGSGNNYFSLDNSCSQGQECWDYCQSNEITTQATFTEDFNKYFNIVKESVGKLFGRQAVGGDLSSGICTSKSNVPDPAYEICNTINDEVTCISYFPICDYVNGQCINFNNIACDSATDKTICENPDSGFSKLCIWKESCTPSWQCSTWNSCINNQQTRTCTNLNNCGTNEDKPSEIQTCSGLKQCTGTPTNTNCGDISIADCTKISGCRKDFRESPRGFFCTGIISGCSQQSQNSCELISGCSLVDLPSCNDECSQSGIKECSSSGYRTCGEFDNIDLCLEWSPVTSCSAGESCSDGECNVNCGDNIVGSGEQCDDGNTDSLDGCSSSCKLENPVFSEARAEANRIVLTWNVARQDIILTTSAIYDNKLTGNTVKDTFDNFYNGVVDFFKKLFEKKVVGIGENIKGFYIYRAESQTQVSNPENLDYVKLNNAYKTIGQNANQVRCTGTVCTYYDNQNLQQEKYYYYKISGVNINGIESESSSIKFAHFVSVSSDTQKPTSLVSAPTNQATLSSLKVISGIASDNVAVSKVEIQIFDLSTTPNQFFYGGGWANTGTPTWLDASQTNSWYYIISYNNGNIWAEGHNYKICSRATDSSNNIQDPITCNTFTYSTTTSAPTITITSPTQDTVSGTISVQATTTDTNPDNWCFDFLVDNVIYNNLRVYCPGSPSITFSWDTTSASNGQHTISVRLSTVQNVQANKIIVVNNIQDLDSTPPTIIALNPASNSINEEIDENIAITFSESMTENSKDAFSLRDLQNNIVSGVRTWDNEKKILTFNPINDLQYNKNYTINITTDAEDLAGNNLINRFGSSFKTIQQTTTSTSGENSYENGCNNNIDDDNDGVFDGLDKDCATGEKVTISSINTQFAKPFEDSEFEVQCKIFVSGATATFNRAQPCVFANLSSTKSSVSQLCEFLSRNVDTLKFKCNSGSTGEKVISCQVDTIKCNGDLQTLSKNIAQRFINITSPNLCAREIGQERLSITNIDLDDKQYKVNEKIKPGVEVNNPGDDDLDIVTEVYLYDINSQKQLTKTNQNKLIQDSSSSEFNLELNTPSVPASKYRLYFKTYLKNQENEICLQDSLNVDIKASVSNVSGCQDLDRDGYPGSSCGGTDCNDNNVNIKPGTVEICTDNIDNDCNGLTDSLDAACLSGLTCNSGETRECGLNIGECKKGTQTCTNDVWGTCSGEVKPSKEICNDNLDNDCNGLTDCSDADCSGASNCFGTGDADKDGLPDEWELNYFGNLQAQSGDDDFDDDGFTNIQEYSKSTNPTDPSSVPEKESSALTTVIIVVVVLAIAGILVWLFVFKPKKPLTLGNKPPLTFNKPSAQVSGVTTKVSPVLINYIKGSLQKGYKKQQIKNALIMKGWHEKDIDEAFKNIK